MEETGADAVESIIAPSVRLIASNPLELLILLDADPVDDVDRVEQREGEEVKDECVVSVGTSDACIECIGPCTHRVADRWDWPWSTRTCRCG